MLKLKGIRSHFEEVMTVSNNYEGIALSLKACMAATRDVFCKCYLPKVANYF